MPMENTSQYLQHDIMCLTNEMNSKCGLDVFIIQTVIQEEALNAIE